MADDKRTPNDEERQPEELKREGRTAASSEKPLMEDLGTPEDDASPDDHSG